MALLVGMASAASAKFAVVDVALTQDNILRGQLVTSGGQPKSKSLVLVSTGKEIICRATTNDQGVFAVSLDRGGIYILSHGEAATVVRAWTAQAAPPSAKNGILVVSDEDVSRAQLAHRRLWGQPSGHRYGPITKAAIIGAMAGVIYLAADNDDGS